jgi:hypothetical protein
MGGKNSTLSYMTNTLNQIIIFFPPSKTEYFFQQYWESEYLFRKKNIPLPLFKLNAMRDKKNKYSNSRVVRKQISERNKKP